MKRLLLVVGSIIFLSFPATGFAQWTVGPHIIISVPRTEFANVSDVGGGFGIKGILQLGPEWFGVRGDFAFLSHGREPTIVDGFFGEISNESIRLSFGPTFRTALGRDLRLYATGQGGFYLFRTNTNVNLETLGFFTRSKNDAAVGWSAGGGIQYDIGLGPWIDASVEYLTIYNITTEFDVDEETVSRDITANEITIKVGVTFFLD